MLIEHPCTIDELFSELDHMQPNQYLTVQEMQPGFEDLWLDDGDPVNTYIAEIVVPVVRTRSSEAPLDPEIPEAMRLWAMATHIREVTEQETGTPDKKHQHNFVSRSH